MSCIITLNVSMLVSYSSNWFNFCCCHNICYHNAHSQTSLENAFPELVSAEWLLLCCQVMESLLMSVMLMTIASYIASPVYSVMILFSSPNPRLYTLHSKCNVWLREKCIHPSQADSPKHQTLSPHYIRVHMGSGPDEIVDHWSPCNLMCVIIKPKIFTRKQYLFAAWLAFRCL